ncbi:MAG: thiamine pyrophosphate protein, partial [uncultured bacterium]
YTLSLHDALPISADFGPALERAMASGQPALLHCLIDPQAITPMATLDQLRQHAMHAQRTDAPEDAQ